MHFCRLGPVLSMSHMKSLAIKAVVALAVLHLVLGAPALGSCRCDASMVADHCQPACHCSRSCCEPLKTCPCSPQESSSDVEKNCVCSAGPKSLAIPVKATQSEDGRAVATWTPAAYLMPHLALHTADACSAFHHALPGPPGMRLHALLSVWRI